MISLRDVRAERLLSIRDLARKASVAASTVYLIEAGRTTPQLHVVARLADALGVAPSEVTEFRRAIEASKVRLPRRRAQEADKEPAGPDCRVEM
jgi:transcriptional regulator with XRE-family HTH domain